MKNLLQLKNISFSIKKTSILKDISFSVKKGEIVSIIGVNGAGKSTLLKIIAGILKETNGEIIKNYSKIAYVPQKIDIDKSFPINVLEFINIYNPKTSKEKVRKYFKNFGAENLLTKQLSFLSGGEFQKVLIISALIGKPELLLLDEPTAGVDIIGEDNFYKNIAEIKKVFKDISIILVSHNLHLVYKNSDRVICLHKDDFCCHGTPSQIQANEKVEKLFGKYTLPYEHNPHKHCKH
ncbi:metal ABC transporter ATP-binding protein [Candidatus Gracilibacteria bacterium]|nr:metal ABC transporter ATP-binding protein [Candidatus Gracilibacteria bacterium]